MEFNIDSATEITEKNLQLIDTFPFPPLKRNCFTSANPASAVAKRFSA
jgi:hypothetical protein